MGVRISLAQEFIPDGGAEAANSKQKKHPGTNATLPDPHREEPWLQYPATAAPLGRARSARHVIKAKTKPSPLPPAPVRARPLPFCLLPTASPLLPRRRVVYFRCGRTLHARGRLFYHKRKMERWFNTQATESR